LLLHRRCDIDEYKGCYEITYNYVPLDMSTILSFLGSSRDLPVVLEMNQFTTYKYPERVPLVPCARAATNLLPRFSYLFLFPFKTSLSEFVLGFPCLALTSQFGWLGRHEERKKIMHDIGRGDARDVSVVVRRCDFDDVRATMRKEKRLKALLTHTI
jgi:hypothetical protein